MDKIVVTLYGISNCDTIKKSKIWLDQAGITYRFHDYRKQGLTINKLNQWIDYFGWSAMLNRRGTTWRQLSEDKKATLDRESATTIMLENLTIIKRPLLDKDGVLHLGFSDTGYRTVFGLA